MVDLIMGFTKKIELLLKKPQMATCFTKTFFVMNLNHKIIVEIISHRIKVLTESRCFRLIVIYKPEPRATSSKLAEMTY
ncbi:hypothetical protein BpHYR1_043144 [Brachionus plicatilis]|uniref:Uncharacterized protein n=1 Tax=Brachionus plicatilis TaxID=10195 RepID=A0A3M7R089_BRAPC|nr:hypothetical protein BpHYR1_043144 [Brachionus plicatilis]